MLDLDEHELLTLIHLLHEKVDILNYYLVDRKYKTHTTIEIQHIADEYNPILEKLRRVFDENEN